MGKKQPDPERDSFDRLVKLAGVLLPLRQAETAAEAAIKVARIGRTAIVASALITALAGAVVLMDKNKTAADPRTKQSSPPTPSPSVSVAPSPSADPPTPPSSNPPQKPDGKRSKPPVPQPSPPGSQPSRTASPAPSGSTRPLHGGPTRGRLTWDPDTSSDVDDVGFRSGSQLDMGNVFARASGIWSIRGVRMRLVPKANLSYSDCAEIKYDEMVVEIARSDIRAGHTICAYDGIQYVAAYEIEEVPSAEARYVGVLARSWSNRP